MKMKFTLLISLTILSKFTIAATNDCAMIKKFGGVGGQELKDITNPPICKSIKKTCCSDTDFGILKKNYNGPTGDSEEPNGALYQRKVNQVWGVIERFQKNLPGIKSEAVNLLKQADLSVICKGAATALKDITFDNALLKVVKTNFDSCLKKYDGLRKGFYCGMCDGNKVNSYVYNSNQVHISKTECKEVFNACSEHTSFLHSKIYIWFEELEKMSRCDSNGKTSATKAKVDRQVSSTTAARVVSCKTQGGTGTSCESVCESGFKFGQESDIFHGSSDYLNTVIYNWGKNFVKGWKFTPKVLDGVKTMNAYYKYKNKSQGTKPADPTDKRFFKINRISTRIQTGSGGEFSDDGVKSGLKAVVSITGFISRLAALVVGLVGFVLFA